MRETSDSLQRKNTTDKRESSGSLLVGLLDFSRQWNWPNLTEDVSIFLNIFRETLSMFLLKRDALLSDYIVSC